MAENTAVLRPALWQERGGGDVLLRSGATAANHDGGAGRDDGRVHRARPSCIIISGEEPGMSAEWVKTRDEAN